MSWPEIAGDPRFYLRTGPHALAAVAQAAGGQAPALELMIEGVAPLQTAGPAQVSFLDNRRYLPALEASRAGAVIVHPEMAAKVPEGTVAIVTTEPYVGWARVAALFHPVPPPVGGVHASAVAAPDAEIDPSAEVGPLAVIGAGARIGPRCRIAPLAVIGPGVVMGADCRVGSHASVACALLGDRVYVYPGARIGQEGFGFAPTAQGFLSVPQLGRVILEDDVEIGANTTIDRGSAHDTVIGAGSRLDNLVQIGHNVRLGRACVIVSQAGISGSTVLGDQVMLGGQAGLTGHLKIGTRARIGAQAGVMADVPERADVVGSPAEPVRVFFRQMATLRKLSRQRQSDDKADRQAARESASGGGSQGAG
jgi:UDP-3-O-[3-hydroxymyristoyl] glucosamine N-acyltransferase